MVAWEIGVVFAVAWIVWLTRSLQQQCCRINQRFAEPNDKIVFVISHPDDEAMFFVPSISALAQKHSCFLLCLSHGDYEGLGQIRARELVKSAALLGIPSERVKVLDHPQLQDGPKQIWETQLVAEVIEGFVKEHHIAKVISFDNYGISGHPNHIATSLGVRAFAQLSPHVQCYELMSCSLLRKYISILDIPLSLASFFSTRQPSTIASDSLQPNNNDNRHSTNHPQLRSRHTRREERPHLQHPFSKPPSFLFVSTAFHLSHRVMLEHASQFVWYRRLFVWFSRYAFVNPLRLIDSSRS